MDAALQTGWTSSHDRACLSEVETVGHCIFEDDAVLKVALNYSDGLLDGIQSIPIPAIISKKYIKLDSQKHKRN